MTPSTTRFTVFSIALLLARIPVFGAEPADHASHQHAGKAACPFAAAPSAPGELPEQVGQDAFVALAEMRSLLTGDPATDWSRVDLDAFREHLVDMNRVVLDAEISVEPVPGGFEARVIGSGRTLDAIQRMVPAHSRFVDGRDGLRAVVSPLEEVGQTKRGVVVTVTTAEPSAIARVRGLGFFGFLVAGDHHRPHHRAMALGAGHP